MDAHSPTGTPHSAPAAILPLIEQELAIYSTLEAVVREERKCLTDRDFDGLTRVLAEKHQLVNQLETLSQTRSGLLAANQCSIDRDGLEHLFTLLEPAAARKAHAAWDALNDSVTACQRLNEINARIAHRGQANNRHILHILRGGSDQPSLYGPSGGRDPKGATDPISRA